ncbi:MAG: HAMP domain-containing histidine kinase, partial [Desulfobulbaceae bacterium]|nr:HAMP domain-containing histidine kinase [Desulfobulbaceae bacterium]HIJ90189.1 HAMP domain-containing histidine kinase [Deltaproteobacteria bacterium]
VGGGAINVVMSEKDDQIVIRYSDNGSGMPPEVRAKIFEPFYTTKERGKETGLGMAIINDIIVDHNGKIICESEQGKGTTFTITLPILKN